MRLRFAALVALAATCMCFARHLVAQGLAPVARTNDVAYGAAGGVKLLLDVLRPVGRQGLRPAILTIHGGGWSQGDKSEFVQAAILAQMGYVVFNANYRLVTPNGNRFPAQLRDVQEAVRWVRANAAKYGVNPKRIGVVGVSAGGHLAALLGVTDAPKGGISSRPSCVVSVAGPADLTVRLPKAPTMDVERLVEALIGKPRPGALSAYRAASPAALVGRSTPPFLLVHGKADKVVPFDQSVRFEKALRRAGVPVELVACQGGHDFALPADQTLLFRSVTAFLMKYLPVPPAPGPGAKGTGQKR